jgi:hypothetical protein
MLKLLILDLDFTSIGQHADWTAQGIANISPVQSIPIIIEDKKARLVVPIGMIAMASVSANVCERLLVSSIIRASLELSGAVDIPMRIGAVLRELAISDDDRFVHLFQSRTPRDFLHEFDRGEPEFVADEDIAFGSIRVTHEAQLFEIGPIVGSRPCNAALNKLVDSFLEKYRIQIA